MLPRLVIIDDHTLFREGLRSLLAASPWFLVVGDTGEAKEAVPLIEKLEPSLVLLDLQLPGVAGLELVRQILALKDAPKVLLMTGRQDMGFVPEAIHLGIAGCLRKECPSTELIRAIHTALDGKVHLCPEAATAISESLRGVGTQGAGEQALSERENQVLALVAQGLRNKEIADRLGVSIKSVETYRSRLMTKLGCASTAELLRYAVSHGL